MMLAVSTYKFTFRRFSTSKRTREIPASGEHLPPTEQTARGNDGYSLLLTPARPRAPTRMRLNYTQTRVRAVFSADIHRVGRLEGV